jgi:hypothetical protein
MQQSERQGQFVIIAMKIAKGFPMHARLTRFLAVLLGLAALAAHA